MLVHRSLSSFNSVVGVLALLSLIVGVAGVTCGQDLSELASSEVNNRDFIAAEISATKNKLAAVESNEDGPERNRIEIYHRERLAKLYFCQGRFEKAKKSLDVLLKESKDRKDSDQTKISGWGSLSEELLKLSSKDGRKVAAAYRGLIVASLNSNTRQLFESCESFRAVLGEDHIITKLALLELSRISEYSRFSANELELLIKECEEKFGTKSLQVADANFVFGQNLVDPLMNRIDVRAPEKLKFCLSVYELNEDLVPSRLALACLHLANSCCKERDFRSASFYLQRCSQLIRRRGLSEQIKLPYRIANANYSMDSTNWPVGLLNFRIANRLVADFPALKQSKIRSSFHSFVGIGYVSVFFDRPEEAKRCFGEAEKVLNTYCPSESQRQINMASLNLLLGTNCLSVADLEGARRYMKKVIPAYREHAPESVPIAAPYAAAIQIVFGENDEAVHLLSEGIKTMSVEDSTTIYDPQDLALSYHYRAVANWRGGNREAALNDFQNSQEVTLNDCQKHLLFFNVSNSVGIANNLNGNTRAMVATAIHEPTAVEPTLDLLMQTKGLSTGFLKFRHAAQQEFQSASFEKQKIEYSECCEEFSTALNRSTPDELIVLEEKKAQSLARLVSLLPTGAKRSFRPQKGQLSRLMQKLPPRDVVIEFAIAADPIHVGRPVEVNGKRIRGVDKYVAYVIRNDSVDFFVVGEVGLVNGLVDQRNREIQRYISRMDRFLKKRESDAPTGVIHDVESDVGNDVQLNKETLDQLLWSKLLPAIRGSQRLVICPIGGLIKAPWAMMRDPTNQRHLVQDYEIVLNDNAAEVLVGLEAVKMSKPGVLSIGGLDFGEAAGGKSAFRKLAASGKESQAVVDSFEKIGQAAKILTGAKVDVAALASEVKKYGVLHIASHSATIQEMRSEGDQERLQFAARHPLVDSAIVLSGANLDGKNPDRFMTGEQIVAELDLRHVDLAILSICRAADGAILATEGAFGVEKAVRLAGAKSTLTSQFTLVDSKAKLFVETFCKNWQQKKRSKSAAFRMTVREMIERGERPYVWGGWRLTGDGR